MCLFVSVYEYNESEFEKGLQADDDAVVKDIEEVRMGRRQLSFEEYGFKLKEGVARDI
jgi:hypothetical protein